MCIELSNIVLLCDYYVYFIIISIVIHYIYYYIIYVMLVSQYISISIFFLSNDVCSIKIDVFLFLRIYFYVKD